jgi:hypothetical protein
MTQTHPITPSPELVQQLLARFHTGDTLEATWAIAFRAGAALAQPDQDDKTLKAIRETTPRYRMSVIVSTNDSAIDTRMHVIWQALDPSKEILESVSLPEQLPPPGNQ